jgi:hypothetical protein
MQSNFDSILDNPARNKGHKILLSCWEFILEKPSCFCLFPFRFHGAREWGHPIMPLSRGK